MHFLEVWFRNQKLSVKLSLVYIPLSILCAIFLCLTIYKSASAPIIERITNESTLIAEGIQEDAQDTLDDIILAENQIKEMLYRADAEYRNWKIYQTYYPKELEISCAMYRENNTCAYSSNPELAQKYDLTNEEVSQFYNAYKAIDYLNEYKYTDEEMYIPRISRCLASGAKDQIAYMITFINASTWRSDLNGYRNHLGDSIAVMLNENDIVIQATSIFNCGDHLGECIEGEGKDQYGELFTVAGEDYYKVSTGADKNGFKVAVFIPLQTISKQLEPVAGRTATILLIYSFLILLLLLTVNRMITKPLKRMTDDLEARGDTPYVMTNFHEKYEDEIGMLSKAFKRKSQEIEQYIIRIEEMEKKYHDAETLVFTAQMNPHLLYNTLATIIWLIRDDKKEQAIEATQSLATLLKNSLNRDHEVVKVRAEVEHLRDYIKIQQLRYYDRFRYILFVDEDIMQCAMPSMVLQPLFENAIYHGIKLRQTIGIIKVEGRRVGSDIVFTISDNGPAGAEEISRINSSLSAGEAGDLRIGTKNVHMRIRYHYGEQYGLFYEKKGEFTVVTVKIPAEEGADDNV